MLLVVPDSALAAVLASRTLMEQIWPGASQDVMMLLTSIRPIPMRNLGDLLMTLTCITMFTPVMGAPVARIVLAYRTVVLTAFARDAAGDLVRDPHDRRAEVVRLDVVQVAVGGQSALKAAM